MYFFTIYVEIFIVFRTEIGCFEAMIFSCFDVRIHLRTFVIISYTLYTRS